MLVTAIAETKMTTRMTKMRRWYVCDVADNKHTKEESRGSSRVKVRGRGTLRWLVAVIFFLFFGNHLALWAMYF